MRIAMVSEHANPLAALGGVDAGGQNVHVAALAKHLVAAGHEVTVFSRRDEPGAPDRVATHDGYVVEHVPAGPPTEVPKDELLPYMAEFGRYLTWRWAVERPMMVHTHFWMSGLAGTAAAAAVGVPVVHTFHALGTVKRRHQGPADTSPAQRIELERRLCRDVDHVVATCSDEVRELQAMGMPVDRTTVVPCGVDTALFRPQQPDDTVAGPRTRRHRLLSVGRLVERKGVADAVVALQQLPDAELVVAGGPAEEALHLDPEVQRLRAVADQAGTADRVRFVGRVGHEDMPGLFASADVVVCTPWYEPFGIVPVEAMACGRPVVGTAVGGLLDTVVPGTTGELVPPRDPAALAAVLTDLLADEPRRRRYGAAGVLRAQQTYRWDSVAQATEQVYATVAAARRTGQPTGVPR